MKRVVASVCGDLTTRFIERAYKHPTWGLRATILFSYGSASTRLYMIKVATLTTTTGERLQTLLQDFAQGGRH